jgi:hypothetical protein
VLLQPEGSNRSSEGQGLLPSTQELAISRPGEQWEEELWGSVVPT